jgi:phosphate-selective porin
MLLCAPATYAAERALLDILLENGVISQAQYETLLQQETLSSEDILPGNAGNPSAASTGESAAETNTADDDSEDPLALEGRYTSSGFQLRSQDGNWETELQWRAQLRASTPFDSAPRQLGSFAGGDETNFEARRLRMKVGGHGFQPWLEYYVEVDLQPSRDVDDSPASASARVIDYRIDVAKWNWGSLRVGQWKIDYNRERVDSSGRQQFVERSIATRVFTLDRQIGIALRGRVFKETRADLRYAVGVFDGEGRGVNNASNNLMYLGRLQWNFLGRDPAFRQTDVDYTERPTGSLAVAAATTTGPCTRWSSSGCGNLDGFASPASAAADQFDVDQQVQEFAFKYRGLSIQQEYHRKTVDDRVVGTHSELTGGYVQAGYFFHHLFPAVPEPLEFAVRYAAVDEPNAVDLSLENQRREYTIGANWFFSGHNNKLTLDYSRLTLEDGLVGADADENRIRLQWDVSF